ncbi:MAG: PVC-type heme-binding CxxCH protein, partial [Planctomycetia bacterium]
ADAPTLKPKDAGATFKPEVSGPSKEGEQALSRIRAADGLKVDLYAAEPMLANPVAFCFDAKGNVYVAETFRHSEGANDIRGLMSWLDQDLAARTVEDRVAMIRKNTPDQGAGYAVNHDRVRMLADTDGDGKPDRSTVFADGFKNIPDGIGAGLLATDGQVYYTCIPDLWLLKDENGDGVADVKKSLSYGYGVHLGFIGHDLHGLTLGPDGRLYFSIGDRGLSVAAADGRRVDCPDTGAVLRCELDGSGLELFATGLRNPQELAFDDHGNLFTGDNNSDGGDQARWVYVVEGGDSGWRIGYQFMTRHEQRGPWNAERLWNPAFDGQAAYIVPPIANHGAGPSGLAYYPGVGLPKKYDGRFFLCDFRGGFGGSGVWSFNVEPAGAGFKLGEPEQTLWGVLATDVDFGPDGRLYVSDWVDGWPKPTRGRLYRAFDPAVSAGSDVRELTQLLGGGVAKASADQAAGLLHHADRRV